MQKYLFLFLIPVWVRLSLHWKLWNIASCWAACSHLLAIMSLLETWRSLFILISMSWCAVLGHHRRTYRNNVSHKWTIFPLPASMQNLSFISESWQKFRPMNMRMCRQSSRVCTGSQSTGTHSHKYGPQASSLGRRWHGLIFLSQTARNHWNSLHMSAEVESLNCF